MNQQLIKEFGDHYRKMPEYIFFCPGRINLIGEHIDYNGGRVMPCAISQGTWLAVSNNADKRLRFCCLNFPEKADLPVQMSYSKADSKWFNFPLGVINEITQKGHSIPGLDMLFFGNLPIGAGLSSSASIEIVTAFALTEMLKLNSSRKELALLCKKVENEFIGVNCGIMDQFAVAFGKKDKAILLNCDTLEYEYLPLHLDEHVLVIINTNKERKLTESKYNERFSECGSALKALKKALPVSNLCDLSISTFEASRQLIDDPVLVKRALHVISENERVMKAAGALKKGELEYFGKLMYDSHQSLKELYEVSGKELDTIVDFCKSFEGCIGARMTGAGFGGCAIALIKKGYLTDFSERISVFYKGRVGYKPGVFATEAGEGVARIN